MNIDPEFQELITSELEKAKDKINVREHVKRVWMYPKFSYDPWTPLDLPDGVLDEVRRPLSNIQFKLQMIDGKVYAAPSTNLCTLIYDRLDAILEKDIVPNIESSHITIVNSNIVYDCGVDNVKEFMDQYTNEFEVTYGKIKSTTSRDWAIFSKCYIIEISSDELTKFVEDFNVKFKKTINPNLHITFAIKPRDLFYH